MNVSLLELGMRRARCLQFRIGYELLSLVVKIKKILWRIGALPLCTADMIWDWNTLGAIERGFLAVEFTFNSMLHISYLLRCLLQVISNILEEVEWVLGCHKLLVWIQLKTLLRWVSHAHYYKVSEGQRSGWGSRCLCWQGFQGQWCGLARTETCWCSTFPQQGLHLMLLNNSILFEFWIWPNTGKLVQPFVSFLLSRW